MSMSDESLVLHQRQIQQRQILAMMGISQWIQPDSPTLNIATLEAMINESSTESSTRLPQTESPVDHDTHNTKTSTQDIAAFTSENENLKAVEQNYGYQETATQVINDPSLSQNNLTHKAPVTDDTEAVNIQDYRISSEPTIDTPTAIEKLAENPATTISNNQTDSVSNEERKVPPFDLQGGRYGNWVLMVDIQALDNHSQKLWQNICQALSLECETTSFPICEGMDTLELANASIAGYIFKIGRSDTIKVASLTPLPSGLRYANRVIVPTLAEMLEDAMLKQNLWQQLSKPQ